LEISKSVLIKLSKKCLPKLSLVGYNIIVSSTNAGPMPQKKTVVIYANKRGREPFSEWFSSLKDRTFRARVRNRISRLELGNFGDCEPVGEGVFELRLFFGSGLRVYFAEYESTEVILLCGGDKKTQNKDILKAKDYWKEFKDKEGKNEKT